MKKVIHRAEDRGTGNYGWLKTRYSFSFADWYNPSRMGFGALRVINDDIVAPGSGFAPHSHRDMEIITIVTGGTLTHKDNMGNVGTVQAGDVQVMSAGRSVTHSEYNLSKTEPLSLFQIWIEPKKLGIDPRYAQKYFALDGKKNDLTLLVGPDTRGEWLLINQDAYIYHAALDKKHPILYTPKQKENGAYIFVIEGNVTVVGEKLSERDAIGVSDIKEIRIESSLKSILLIIEVPI